MGTKAYPREIEWEYTASVIGTVYARSEEEAREAARYQLSSVFADIEEIYPVDLPEVGHEGETYLITKAGAQADRLVVLGTE